MSNLASDLNNQNFTGARNPDELLHVTFHTKTMKNEFKSQQAGRPIFDEVDMVRITTPGNQLNIIDTFVREEHKIRFPRQWAIYQNMKEKGDIGDQTVGTPLAEWPAISRSEAEEYRALKFFTVEQIANASDLQIQRLGMNGFPLRDKARAFLNQASDTALAQHQAAELEKRNAEIKDLKDQMALMSARFEQMMQAKEEPKKRKYTRRAKTEDAPTNE